MQASAAAAYDLLGKRGEISCIRLGNTTKIPEINVINYELPKVILVRPT